MITIILNDTKKNIDESLTIENLILEEKVNGRYAVEVNERIIPKSKHSEYRFEGNDKVEIVTAVGGG